jgi:hypothetical protein
MLWRNGCDGKVLRCGAGDRHQHLRSIAHYTSSSIAQCTAVYCPRVSAAARGSTSDEPEAAKSPGVEIEIL